MRIGTSFISYEQAELNLKTELPDWDFERAKDRSREAWAKELARLDIKGATDDQKSTFYTAIYRVLQFPRALQELDREGSLIHYSPYDNGKIHKGPLYTDSGLLGHIPRGVSVLRALLSRPQPDDPRRLAQCVSRRRTPSELAKPWQPPMHDRLARRLDLCRRVGQGLRSFDLNDAWEAVKKNAYENDPGSWAGRDHLDDFIHFGYVPVDKREHAASSCTLEYSYGDWCVAQIAKASGHERSTASSCSARRTTAMSGTQSQASCAASSARGSWREPFDPLAWGGAWVEGNAWQWLWSVQHDPYGLMELLGGPDAMAKKLDEFLTMPSTSVPGTYGHLIHEMKEVEYAKMASTRTSTSRTIMCCSFTTTPASRGKRSITRGRSWTHCTIGTA